MKTRHEGKFYEVTLLDTKLGLESILHEGGFAIFFKDKSIRYIHNCGRLQINCILLTDDGISAEGLYNSEIEVVTLIGAKKKGHSISFLCPEFYRILSEINSPQFFAMHKIYFSYLSGF